VLYFGPRRPSTLERETPTITLAVLAELPTTLLWGALHRRETDQTDRGTSTVLATIAVMAFGFSLVLLLALTDHV
jgi:hypothetical protein